ncbi:MAG: penicillin-binding protein activator [Bacteriovoracia bacterium]
MSQLIRGIVATSLVYLLFACSSASKRPNDRQVDLPGFDGDTSSLSGTEAKDFQLIQDAYLKNQADTAMKRARAFEKKYPHTTKRMSIQNLMGLIQLRKKNYRAAIDHFEKSLAASGDAVQSQYLLYNLGIAQYESNKFSDARKSLETIDARQVNLDTARKLLLTRALVYQKLDMPTEAARDALAWSLLIRPSNDMPLAKDDENARRFENEFKPTIEKITDPATLERLLRDSEEGPFADFVLFRLANAAMVAGQRTAAENYLRTLINRYPDTTYYPNAMELLKSLQNQNIVDAKAVGVLLPMTGRFAKMGALTLQGIALAFRTFNPNEPDSRIHIIVEDMGENGDPVEAINRLYFKHHVVAIIGPIRNEKVEEASQRAQSLGVPLISLAQKKGIDGDYVFQAAITGKNQVYEIARYAVQAMKLKKFAVIYPEENIGIRGSRYFWDAIEEMGGEVRAFESYRPGETDFRQVVDKLVGLHYQDARKRESDEMAAIREKNKITKHTRRNDEFFSLPPIVDFDAVFMPDEARAARQAVPTFAYRDVENLKFFGISTWNSENLLERGKNSSEPIYFVDTYAPENTSPENQTFVSRYVETYGTRPTALEATAYDAATLLETIMLTGDNVDRSEIKNRLMRIKNFSGVTGKITYGDGQLNRQLRVLTVKNGKIQEASSL